MRSLLCLITLTVIGIALLVAPPSLFRLDTTLSRSELLGWWLASLKTVAVPFVLVILRLANKNFARLSALLWGLWLTFASVSVVSRLGALCPNASLYGEFLATLIVIISIALVLFSTIELKLASRIIARPEHPPGENTAAKP